VRSEGRKEVLYTFTAEGDVGGEGEAVVEVKYEERGDLGEVEVQGLRAVDEIQVKVEIKPEIGNDV
jgi:hypothetical protein